jgi:hypothetical protein
MGLTLSVIFTAVYLFEDLAVSAYAGIMNQFKQDQDQQLELIKMLSVDSYQSGLVRSWLFQNGAYPVDWFNSMQVTASNSCLF